MRSRSSRRADRFAELLEDANTGRRRHRRDAPDAELSALVSMTSRVGAAPIGAAPDPQFRDGLRAMLLAKIERDGIGATAEPRDENAATWAALEGTTQVVRRVPAGRTGRTRAAVLIGVTAGALALSGVSAASTDALPGDPLYQVKRSSEQAQLALAGSDQARGNLYLEFARARLREAEKVDADRVADALAETDRETLEGVSRLTILAADRHDATALGGIHGFLDHQRKHLAELGTEPSKSLPAAAEVSLRQSGALLTDVEKRVDALTRAFASNCQTFGTDELGAKPNC